MSAVKSVVSADSTATSTDSFPWSTCCFFKMPNLRDEVKAGISKASAWATWAGIFDAMNDQIVRGRTDEVKAAAAAGKIGVGLYAIARAVGIDPATVRRQARRLEKLGLIVIHTPAIVAVHDPKTGKIVSKRLGRTPPCTILVTVTEDHLRPFAKGAKRTLSGDDKVQSAPPVKVQSAAPSEDSQRTFKRTRRPAATSGVGRPAAGVAGRLTAAGPGPAPCRPFDGDDADRFARTKARLDAERAERERQNSEWSERAKAAAAADDVPVIVGMGDRQRRQRRGLTAIADLQAAVTALPATSKARAKKVGRKIRKSAKAQNDEAKALQAIIDAKRSDAAKRDAEARNEMQNRRMAMATGRL